MHKKLKILTIYIFVLLLLLPVVLPFFNSSFFTVHDNTQVERVFQMTKSLKDGNFPVRWVDDLGYGYGYPIFNFYAPLPYYLGGFVNLLINNSLTAAKIMFVIGVLMSFFTMYFFASRLISKTAGIVAGIAYLYFPYHAVNIYVRGAVGELFAYAFLPLVFLGFYLIYKKSSSKNLKLPLFAIIFTSVSIFLVTISHNLSIFMLGLFLVPYVLVLFMISSKKNIFLNSILIIFILSLFLSSFYILPAVFESKFTNVQSQIGGGADYKDHFICLVQLWSSNWGFGGSTIGCLDGLSFMLGKINIIFLSAAFVMLAYSLIKNRKMSMEVLFWGLLLISILLMTVFSKVFWNTIPFMEYLQYPWRFLNFAGIFISVIIAFFVERFNFKKNLIYATAFIVVFLTIFLNMKYFYPNDTVNFSNSFYEDPSHIRWTTSKISDEYLPQRFEKPEIEKDVPNEIIELVNPNSQFRIVASKTGYIEIIKSGDASSVHINKAYFPSWEAFVDGEKVDLVEETKGMSLDLPEGRVSVVIKFTSSPIQRLGNALTSVGIIAIFIVIIVKRKKLYG